MKELEGMNRWLERFKRFVSFATQSGTFQGSLLNNIHDGLKFLWIKLIILVETLSQKLIWLPYAFDVGDLLSLWCLILNYCQHLRNPFRAFPSLPLHAFYPSSIVPCKRSHRSIVSRRSRFSSPLRSCLHTWCHSATRTFRTHPSSHSSTLHCNVQDCRCVCSIPLNLQDGSTSTIP